MRASWLLIFSLAGCATNAPVSKTELTPPSAGCKVSLGPDQNDRSQAHEITGAALGGAAMVGMVGTTALAVIPALGLVAVGLGVATGAVVGRALDPCVPALGTRN
jgi:hypothetical protein